METIIYNQAISYIVYVQEKLNIKLFIIYKYINVINSKA